MAVKKTSTGKAAKAPAKKAKVAAPKAAAKKRSAAPKTAAKKPVAKKAASKVAPPAPRAAVSPSAKKLIKKPAPRKNTKLREIIRTEEERLQQLAKLPSLKRSPRASARKAVEPDAGPPNEMLPPAAIHYEVEAATGSEPGAQYIDRGLPIPEHYGMDRLMAVPRDANWIYAYWELAGGALDRLRFQHSAEVIDNSRWVLSIRALDSHARYLVDIDLRAEQWYLKVAAGTRFQIDLGFVNQRGEFTLVVRGNEVRTPRAELSEVADEAWMVTREDLTALLEASGAGELPEKHTGGSENGPVAFAPGHTGIFSGNWAAKQE